MGFPFPLGILNCNIELEFANKNFNQSISQIYLLQTSRMKHKEQSEYVDRTQRQYETALHGRSRLLKSGPVM